MNRQFQVVIPAKALLVAKSRLGALPDPVRHALVGAFLLDTVLAASQADLVSGVHVVTDETSLAARATRLGAGVLPDRGRGDLNRALLAAAATVADAPVAILLGDLPCLTSASLDRVLDDVAAPGRGVFVADTAGTGTTMLAVADRSDLRPRFGPDSATAHLREGYLDPTYPVSDLRRDIDTLADLAAGQRLGLGPHTRAAIAEYAVPLPH